MRLEKIDGKILVWQTGSKNNRIEYDSTIDKSTYTRRELSYCEDFLRNHDELYEANLIKNFMGKTLKHNQIPQLTPTGSYRINQPVDRLRTTINRYIKEDNLNLNPDFQRGHVWNLEQRIAFVEFLLQGGKTNPIYFNQKGWMGDYSGDMVIVDGKQRLTALLMFLNGEFPVFKSLDSEGIGYFVKEIDVIGISTDVIFVINDLKTREQVLQWYLEMNRGNVAHTKEELDKVETLLEAECKKGDGK